MNNWYHYIALAVKSTHNIIVDLISQSQTLESFSFKLRSYNVINYAVISYYIGGVNYKSAFEARYALLSQVQPAETPVSPK